MLVGPYLGDLVLGVGDRTRGDFTTLFVVAALSVVLPALLVFFLRSPATPRSARRVDVWQFVQATRKYWPGRVVVAGFSFGLCRTVPFVFLANYVDATGLTTSGVSALGLFFFGYGAWGLTVRVLLRQLPDRRGRRKVLIAGLTIMGLGMFSFGWVDASRPRMTIVPGLI